MGARPFSRRRTCTVQYTPCCRLSRPATESVCPYQVLVPRPVGRVRRCGVLSARPRTDSEVVFGFCGHGDSDRRCVVGSCGPLTSRAEYRFSYSTAWSTGAPDRIRGDSRSRSFPKGGVEECRSRSPLERVQRPLQLHCKALRILKCFPQAENFTEVLTSC